MTLVEETNNPGDSESDITDGLSADQLEELMSRVTEPSKKDTISEEEFNKMFARWATK